MFNSLKEKAKSLTDATSKKAEAAISSSTQKGRDLFEEYYPKIEPFIVDGLLSIAGEKLNDEQLMLDCFEKAYEVLPTPVRLMISRGRFLDFTLKHKASLLLKVDEIKLRRIEPPQDPLNEEENPIRN